jgi:hypothetical protein
MKSRAWKKFKEIAPTFAGVIFIAVAVVGLSSVGTLIDRHRRPSLQARIQSLNLSLKKSASLIAEMQGEIESRAALIEKLEADVQRYEKLKELKPEEAEAVEQIIRQELAREGRVSLLRNSAVAFGIALFFFLLGFWTGRKRQGHPPPPRDPAA